MLSIHLQFITNLPDCRISRRCSGVRLSTNDYHAICHFSQRVLCSIKKHINMNRTTITMLPVFWRLSSLEVSILQSTLVPRAIRMILIQPGYRVIKSIDGFALRLHYCNTMVPDDKKMLVVDIAFGLPWPVPCRGTGTRTWPIRWNAK